MKFWKTTSFWGSVKSTLALFGAPAGYWAATMKADPFWELIGIISYILIGCIAIWMTDVNKNEVIDMFED